MLQGGQRDTAVVCVRGIFSESTGSGIYKSIGETRGNRCAQVTSTFSIYGGVPYFWELAPNTKYI